jgi:hypothetical protein
MLARIKINDYVCKVKSNKNLMNKPYAEIKDEDANKNASEPASAYRPSNSMETIHIELDKVIAEKAIAYAKEKGTNLSKIISDYLNAMTSQQSQENVLPDVVKSLIGAGEPIEKDDLNGRKAYNKYLMKKH